MAPPNPHQPFVAQDAIAAAHERLLKHAELQFDLPSFQPPQTPAWMLALQHFLTRYHTALQWIFWIAVAAIGLLVLGLLVRQALKLQWRRDAGDLPAVPAWRPTAEKARTLLSDADALADKGRFTEAVHLILRRSIEDIEERFPRLVRPALTAREIGRLAVIPSSARAIFSAMARLVEQGLFAGAPIGSDDFARCRQDYERFAFPDHWRAAS